MVPLIVVTVLETQAVLDAAEVEKPVGGVVIVVVTSIGGKAVVIILPAVLVAVTIIGTSLETGELLFPVVVFELRDPEADGVF